MPVYSDEPGKVKVTLCSLPADNDLVCKPIVSKIVVLSKSYTTNAISPLKSVVPLFLIDVEIVNPSRYSISYLSVITLLVS